MDSLLDFLQKQYIKKFDCELKFLLDKYSIAEIVSSIIEWLETGKSNYYDITTFARDFYIGSDLTENERENFYVELKRQGFFQHLNNRLCSNSFSTCSWTIYTIGKFSHPENAALLETAYETNYKINNLILAYRCLNELSWLNSKKLKIYLNELQLDKSIISKIILLYYFSTKGDVSNFNEQLRNSSLTHFIFLNGLNIDRYAIVDRLNNLENYIFQMCNSSNDIKITNQNFENPLVSYLRGFDNSQ